MRRSHPQTFETEEGDFILAFDLEERLSAFSEGPAPYAALPGRVIAQSLVGEGVGLGINLGVAESAMLLPPEALEWLATTLTHQPEASEARIEAFHAPALPPAILAALMPAFDAKFETLRGLATHALLAGGVTYEGGRRGHVLAILGAHESSQAGLAKAMSEALMFSGIEAGELDVIFIAPEDRGADDLLAKALVLAIPEREEETAQIVEHKAPGMDRASRRFCGRIGNAQIRGGGEPPILKLNIRACGPPDTVASHPPQTAGYFPRSRPSSFPRASRRQYAASR